jgi:mannose-6-phosphate isomerase-like protein (cupin superfamily)
MSSAAGPRTARMRIFRAADACELDEKIMPMEGLDEAVLAGFQQIEGHGIENGHRVRCLFQEEAGTGMSLVHIWYKSGFVLPRHRHNADCVYYVIAGEIHAGSVVVGQGDGLFIPKDHDYTYSAGPDGVELLEFRNTATFNIVFNGKDPNQWTRIIAAADSNADAWKSQTKPPARRR